jgi:phosphate acetyltransferase
MSDYVDKGRLDMTEPRKHEKYDALIYACHALAPVRTVVAHPCDDSSLTAVIEAAAAKIIKPILVRPEARIRALAASLHLDISGFEVVDQPHSQAAAEKAVQLVRAGRADALMKGSLHTDELMAEVVRKDTGIRTARRVSHVFIMDVPTYAKPLFITDAAVNISPTLEDKADIVQNAIELAQALRISLPKVAILSALETISSKIPSTIDAAALCKMAERGQITGGVLDGPLAFDNAISREAAATKHINSPVAGDADILLVPDLEVGNMLAKELSFLANADAAGIVLGARVPIILTSRADSVRTRMASCAVAALYAHARRMAAAQIGKLAG